MESSGCACALRAAERDTGVSPVQVALDVRETRISQLLRTLRGRDARVTLKVIERW
jgi:hypothetical protein